MIGSIIGGLFAKQGADNAAQANREGAAAARADAIYAADRAEGATSAWSSTGRAALSEISQLLGLGKVVAKDPIPGGGTGRDIQQWELDQTGDRVAGQKDAFGRWQTDPGYQFRMDQGQRALERGAAARGGLLSGRTIKATTQYGQDYASGEYKNYLDRLAALAGAGVSAAGTSAGQGVGAINAGTATAGNLTAQAAQATASGYASLGQGIAGGFKNAFGFATGKGWI